MSLTIDLSSDLEARLRTEAERQGTPVETYLRELVQIGQLGSAEASPQTEGSQQTSPETPEPAPDEKRQASQILSRLDDLAEAFAISLSPPEEALHRDYFYGERG